MASGSAASSSPAATGVLPVLDRPRPAVGEVLAGRAAARAEQSAAPAPSVPPAPDRASSAADRPASIDRPAAIDRPASIDPPAARVRTRRLPHPPGRRAPLWLAALTAGAVLAAAPGLLGSGPQTVRADASDYGLGVAADAGVVGGMADTDVRRGITEAEAQARLGELAASRAAREPTTVLPTQGRLTTCFCMRWGQMHYGLDLAAPIGTPIYSAADGVVIRAGRASGFGNAVYVQDAEGNVHIYGHMRYYDVQAGDIVHAGDQIASVGNEGFSTGPHLHYEIHRGGERGRPIDPRAWLAERGVHI